MEPSSVYVGCSGWYYDSWLGHFYPANSDHREFLKYYSRVFNFVEIDSSFYRPPNLFVTKRWASITPDNFRFTAKFPRSITHEKRLADPENELRYFFDMMRPLQRKLLALLIQLPPSLTTKEGLKKLEILIDDMLDPEFRYAVEVRHPSWFDKSVYKLLSDNSICLAWSQLDTIQTPPELTSDFIYLRFIGDRTINEKDFGRIQKDRLEEMKKWSYEVNSRLKDKAKFAIVAANNHYAGFGPATANSFRKMVGLKEAVWEEMKQKRLS